MSEFPPLRCPKCHLAFEGEEGQTLGSLEAECGIGHHGDTEEGCPGFQDAREALAVCYGPHPGHKFGEFRYWTLQMAPFDMSDDALTGMARRLIGPCPECGREPYSVDLRPQADSARSSQSDG